MTQSMNEDMARGVTLDTRARAAKLRCRRCAAHMFSHLSLQDSDDSGNAAIPCQKYPQRRGGYPFLLNNLTNRQHKSVHT